MANEEYVLRMCGWMLNGLLLSNLIRRFLLSISNIQLLTVSGVRVHVPRWGMSVVLVYSSIVKFSCMAFFQQVQHFMEGFGCLGHNNLDSQGAAVPFNMSALISLPAALDISDNEFT